MVTFPNIEWFVNNRIGVLNSTDPVESPEVRKQLEHEGLVQVVTIRPWPFTMAWSLPDCNLRNVMFRVTDPSAISSRDPRNAAGDPPDYFEYVMLGPGNCTALDKLVFERVMGYLSVRSNFDGQMKKP